MKRRADWSTNPTAVGLATSKAREQVMDKTPYLIVYRERGSEIELLRIWHGPQDWQNQSAD